MHGFFFFLMLLIFGKKGKPHHSVAATLKTSPETAVEGLVWKLRLILKIKGRN